MAIFLTGSTGYIGAHVAANLLERFKDPLNLLVRAQDPHEAEVRLWHALQLHLDFPRFHNHLHTRIHVFRGDLTGPQFGLADDDYAKLQLYLAENPDAGALIEGGGGIRKLRFALPGRGKSGGIRVIYYWAVRRELILLMDISLVSRQTRRGIEAFFFLTMAEHGSQGKSLSWQGRRLPSRKRRLKRQLL